MMLREPAEKNAKTWQFSIHERTTFTITYTYKIVDDIGPYPDSPRVILRFPTEVEVDVQRWPGTHDMPVGPIVAPTAGASLKQPTVH